ncbi:MAG: hypothetical protein ACYC59_01690 [Anaerolineaceae bacterium]
MSKHIVHVSVLVLLLAFLIACGSKPAAETILPTTTPEPTDIPKLMPGEPASAERTLEDADSSIKAEENRTLTGDTFVNNLFERPFTSQEMVYQPDLNILTVSISSDENFHYFILFLDDVDTASGTLSGTYGIEFDRTQTGRGDLLVWVNQAASEWSTEGITVYVNPTGTVGGLDPITAEEDYEGKGYSETIEMEGDKVAWARLAPDAPNAIQIAVSRALLGNPEEFLWGAWADGGVKDPSLFDYDDHFSSVEAGSPLNTSEDYPLQALSSLDNTCRLPHGIEQMSSVIPGMCITSQPGLNCVCTYWVYFGSTKACALWDCD